MHSILILTRAVGLGLIFLGFTAFTSNDPRMPWGDPSQLAIDLTIHIGVTAFLLPATTIIWALSLGLKKSPFYSRWIVNPYFAIVVWIAATTCYYYVTANAPITGLCGFIGATSCTILIFAIRPISLQHQSIHDGYKNG